MSERFTKHQDFKGTKRELTVHDSPPQNGVSKRGMRTRAERARALLISSELPRFLWEEAMRHSAWLQDQTPARALKGKTPYEMGHKKKPHLAGIQEFGAAAYVKDLTAGKLDVRAKKGRFVGYDSESKGYRIYWPEKRSISVERNVVFNQDDTNTHEEIAIIYGEAQSEEEKSKVIQAPQNDVKHDEEPENTEPGDHQPKDVPPEPHQSPKSKNTILFPSNNEPEPQPDSEQPDDTQTSSQQFGRGQRMRHQKGHYKTMNKGLVAAITAIVEEPADDLDFESLDNVDNDFEEDYE